MAHEWIVDVLTDLRAYAQANGLPGVAAKAEEALDVAQKEIGGRRTLAEPPAAAPDWPPLRPDAG